MLTLPPDSELFQMIPSLEKSKADMNQYLLTFSAHSKYPHVYKTHSPLHLFPRQPDDLAIAYEKELVNQKDWIDQELDNFHGDADAKLREVSIHACGKIKHAIFQHLTDKKGKIVSFPFDKPRLLWSGEKGSRSNPAENESVMLQFDPWDIRGDISLDILRDYLPKCNPVKYVNPYKTWAKIHKVIFIATFILYFLSYALTLSPTLFSAYSLVQGSVFFLGLLNLIPMFIFKRKSEGWEAASGTRPLYYLNYQQLFCQFAQSLHRELRFYRLWAQHINRSLPADFDSWEKQLHSLVHQFNSLPTKPQILH